MFLKIDSQSGRVISAFCAVQGLFSRTHLQYCKSEEKMTHEVWVCYSGGCECWSLGTRRRVGFVRNSATLKRNLLHPSKKFSLEQAAKYQRGSRSIALLFL